VNPSGRKEGSYASVLGSLLIVHPPPPGRWGSASSPGVLSHRAVRFECFDPETKRRYLDDECAQRPDGDFKSLVGRNDQRRTDRNGS
jgi:hypothetical protein